MNKVKNLVDISDAMRAIHAHEETMNKIGEGITYYFLPDDTCVHEDDWDEYIETNVDSGDYWSYTFTTEYEEVLLDHFLNVVSNQAAEYMWQLLLKAGLDDQRFDHALCLVLREFI